MMCVDSDLWKKKYPSPYSHDPAQERTVQRRTMSTENDRLRTLYSNTNTVILYLR